MDDWHGPELIASHEFAPHLRDGEPDALFFETHTGFMRWRGVWWVELDGYWFQVHNDPMLKVLQSRWAHLHLLRERAKRSTADPVPPMEPKRKFRPVTTVEIPDEP